MVGNTLETAPEASTVDTFKIDAGSDTVRDLGTGNDIFIVDAGATLNAVDITSFTATGSTTNAASGTANLTAKATVGGVIKMNNAGSGKFTLIAGSGTDTLWGGADDDVFKIVSATQGDADTIDGYGGNDILQLSAGNHTFTTDDNMLKRVEEVKVDDASGSTVDLTNQTEGFTITIGGGTDSVTGSDGDDVISIVGAGDGDTGGAIASGSGSL